LADLLSSGGAWLAGVLRTHASQSITYRRGTDSVSIDATKGKTQWEAVSVHGILVEETESCDWLFAPSELILGSQAVEPIRGDRIVETLSTGVVNTYEVMGFGPNERHFRYSDGRRTLLRVHTKLVSEA